MGDLSVNLIFVPLSLVAVAVVVSVDDADIFINYLDNITRLDLDIAIFILLLYDIAHVLVKHL